MTNNKLILIITAKETMLMVDTANLYRVIGIKGLLAIGSDIALMITRHKVWFTTRRLYDYL